MELKWKTYMNEYVYNHNYPTRKSFQKKSTAVDFIKRALRLYPYVKIDLYHFDGKQFVPYEVWKTKRNKRGTLSIDQYKHRGKR